MFKISILVGLLVVAIGAQAQSIRVFNQCREKSRAFTFAQVDAYSNTIKNHTIGSWCPTQDNPKFRLEVGNYEFRDMPVREGEEWTWFVEKEGKTVRKGIVGKDRRFWTMVGYDERLTIVIAEKFDCNCSVSN